VRSCGLKVVSFGPKFATSFKRIFLDHSAILWSKSGQFWAKIWDLFKTHLFGP
jgi:hypothetical protein